MIGGRGRGGAGAEWVVGKALLVIECDDVGAGLGGGEGGADFGGWVGGASAERWWGARAARTRRGGATAAGSSSWTALCATWAARPPRRPPRDVLPAAAPVTAPSGRYPRLRFPWHEAARAMPPAPVAEAVQGPTRAGAVDPGPPRAGTGPPGPGPVAGLKALSGRGCRSVLRP